MSKDRNQFLARRLHAGLRKVLAVYRYLNIATHHAVGWLLKLLVVAYFIFCAAFLGLRYAVLPNIHVYKADIESLAGRALGTPVSIEKLEASWRGLRPHLVLNKVAIHDRDKRQALLLPKVSATVAWQSLLALDVRLHQLEVVQPDIDIRRDEKGNLYVGGIFVDTNKSGDGKVLDWILAQHEIVIRDGRLRWNDSKRAAPELALNDVSLVLRNQWHRHRFALRATPPAAIASPIEARADFEHPYFGKKSSDVSQWKGELYADLRATDLTAWKPYVDYPIELSQGRGSVRAWLDFDRARVADFTADLMLDNVATRLRMDLQPLDLLQVQGRISVREELGHGAPGNGKWFGAQGHQIAVKDFSFQTRDGLVFPTTTLAESYVPAINGRPEKIQLRAKSLDLRTLAVFAERLPLSAGQRELLADFTPRGQLKDFSVQWEGSYPNLTSYSVKGQFSALSLKAQAPRPARPKIGNVPAQAAVPGIPGFENLTGSVEASDKGGSFVLNSAGLRLNLPGYFGKPVMPFQQLAMRANWLFQKNDQLLLQVDRMDFVQEGLAGSLIGRHLMPLKPQKETPLGQIDLTARISELDISRVADYLPSQTPRDLHAWLTGALVAGKAHNISVRLKGDLADFPFHTTRPGELPKGEFTVSARISGGKLNYAPETFGRGGKAPLWPLTEDIVGVIRFDRTRMEIKADSAKTHGISLTNATVVIPDLLGNDPVLEAEGGADGQLQDFVRYANDSPVADWTAQLTEETRATGKAKLALKLQLPLNRLPDAKVNGALQFAGNDVTLFNILPVLQSASGKLEFTESGIQISSIKANFLGAPTIVAAHTLRDGTIMLKAAGAITGEGVQKAYPGIAGQGGVRRMSGGTRYTAAVTIKNNRRPEIVIDSNLQGLVLDFPAPLQKAANEVLPFRFELASSTPNDAPILKEEIRIALGTMLAARYDRQKPADKNTGWQLVRGGVGINVPAPQPDSGVIVNVNLRSLNLDAWSRFFTSIAANDKSGADGDADSSAVAAYVDPDVLVARAGELIVGGKKLENVVVGASHQKGVWQANLDSDQASGYVTWHQSPTGQGVGRVTARLASLIIPKSAVTEVSNLLEGKNTATQIPALDIVAENFELFGKRFGQLELIAYNTGAGAAREWRIGKLSLVNPDGEFRGTGRWNNRDGESLSSINYTLDVIDAGRLLDRLGFQKVVRGGKGKMTGELQWKGLPFSFDVPSLSGKFDLTIGSGQFLKVDPSAAKLLGVLSLQSLPRRLTLDFRDVFSEGFAFDGISGTANITRGIAKTDNFKMRGVSAAVLMDGSADIARESTDLHVVVIPEVNAGAASLVYGALINPAIGLGTFLAQLFLREPLMKAFTFEYQITGAWSDPVITKLDRKADTAAAPGGTGSVAATPERSN